MVQVASLVDFREQGVPADIGVFQAPCSAMVFRFTFSGTAYIAAMRTGTRGWVLIDYGIDASTIIQAGVNALSAGEKLAVKNGDYLMVTTIVAAVTITLMGEGELTRFIMPNNKDQIIVNMQGANSIVRDLAFIAGTIFSIYKGMLQISVSNVLVEGCYFDGLARGEGVRLNGCTYAKVIGCHFYRSVHGAVYHYAAANCLTTGCTFVESDFCCYVSSYNICVSNNFYKSALFTEGGGAGSNYNVVADNVFREGRLFASYPWYQAVIIGGNYNVAVGNVIENMFYYGIEVGGTNHVIANNNIKKVGDADGQAAGIVSSGSNHVIIGNRIDEILTANSSGGILISEWGVGLNDSIVADNIISNVQKYGIANVSGFGAVWAAIINVKITGNKIVDTYREAIRLAGATWCELEHNTIRNAGRGANNTYAAVLLTSVLTDYSLHNRVTENHIRSTVANKHSYSIREDTANEDYNIIKYNDVNDAATQEISIQGANTKIGYNDGFVTENNVLSPAFAIDAVAVVTVTIPHGCDVTPAVEDCQLTVVEDTNVDDWAEGYVKVESVGAANVVAKVNVTVASATGGATAKLGLHIDLAGG